MGESPSDSEPEASSGGSGRALLPSGDRRRGTGAGVGIIALLAAVGLLASVAFLPGGATAQASFTADDVNVASNAGVVTSLTVAPAGEITYDGLERPPNETTVVVSVRVADGSWERVGNETLDVSTQQGSTSFDFPTIDVFAETSTTPADFRPSDGSRKQVDMDVRLRVTLADAGPGGDDVTATVSDTSTVTVTNEAATAGASGKANTGAS